MSIFLTAMLVGLFGLGAACFAYDKGVLDGAMLERIKHQPNRDPKTGKFARK